jgi:hypothetical protein
MEKLVTVYEYKTDLIIFPKSLTIDGFWFMEEPIVKFKTDISNIEFGNEILNIFKYSRDIPNPDISDDDFRVVLNLFGIKSYKLLYKFALTFSILKNKNNYRFMPYYYREDYKGYGDVRDEDFTIPIDSSFEEIGLAGRMSLEICHKASE